VKKVKLLIAAVFLSLSANAQDVSVDVTSKKLDVDRIEGTAIFTGDVKALYSDLTLTSEVLKIIYDEKAESDNKIKVIIAEENVVLIQGTDRVTAEYAEYYVNQDNIIFKENVVLNRNGNVLEGDHLVMNTITKKAKMTSEANKRVKAVYFKDAKKQPVENNQEGVTYE
jgi:lipopolysaccharide export system protein LptA